MSVSAQHVSATDFPDRDCASDSSTPAMKAIWFVIGMLAVLALAAAMRFIDLDRESLWMDELRQVGGYRLSKTYAGFVEMIDRAAKQQQPPLDYWIGMLVSAKWGSDYALRVPAASFGVGAVFFLMLIVARITTRGIALAAGLAMALMPFAVYYSQEARPYSITMFFVMATMWLLLRLLAENRTRPFQLMVLFLLSVLFLHSRALAPLVVMTTWCALLALRMWIVARRDGMGRRSEAPRLFWILFVLVAAIGAYMPVFRIVLSNSTRFASGGLGWMTVVRGFKGFSFPELWRALVAHTEPITPLFLLMSIVAMVSWFRRGSIRRSSELLLAIWTLPLAACLYTFIFKAKSEYFLRPPYLTFVLPLALVMTAVGFDRVRRWHLARGARLTELGIAAVVGLCFVAALGLYAYGVKSTVKRPDWRGVSNHLKATCGAKQAFAFDSLAPHHLWEPTFYGFRRYYRGPCPQIAISNPKRLPLSRRFKNSDAEPVFILFQWRDYYLTPWSLYPVHLTPAGHTQVDYSPIHDEPAFDVVDFPGFTVIRLKQPSGQLNRDLLEIIEKLVPRLPADSSLVDLYLAAASLAQSTGRDDWRRYMERAIELTDESARPDVRKSSQFIEEDEQAARSQPAMPAGSSGSPE